MTIRVNSVKQRRRVYLLLHRWSSLRYKIRVVSVKDLQCVVSYHVHFYLGWPTVCFMPILFCLNVDLPNNMPRALSIALFTRSSVHTLLASSTC